jgi:hypothetical protein
MYASPLKQSADRTVQYSETYYPENFLGGTGPPIQMAPGTFATNARITVRPVNTFSILGKIEGAQQAPGRLEISWQMTRTLLTNGGSSVPAQPDGSFEIRALAPGEYVLTAWSMHDDSMSSEGYAKVLIDDANVRTEIQTGSAARVRGKAIRSFENASRLQVMLGSSPGWAVYVSDVNAKGDFDIQNIPPGEYWFDVIGPRVTHRDSFYVKTVQCPGFNPVTRQISLDVGTQISNCELTISDDAGAVNGQVTNDRSPAQNLTVLLSPQSSELRRIPRYTRTASADAAGHFDIRGIVPGDYYLFAVKNSEDHAYFAPTFADIHRDEAIGISVRAE